ncbi:hypothetical protein P3G55_16785 [Leptospira sp. 96542]|nr:hypothetical protein [Leptospira sp. 96542]
MRHSKKKFKFYILLLFFLSIYLVSCTNKNPKQFSFWSSYSKLQKAINGSTTNENLISALNGSLSKESENELETDADGNPYVTLAGNYDNNKNWNLKWNAQSSPNFDYNAKTKFTPKFWGKKEIYTVERNVTTKIKGYMPREFFQWLNEFSKIINQHENYQNLKNSSQNLKFLCSSMACNTHETAEWQILEFTLNEDTNAKFPGFFNRTGSRLEKTKFNIFIWDKQNPSHKLKISNVGKTIQFHFPVAPDNNYMLSPKELHFLGDIQIKSFGITVDLQNLEYKLKFKSVGDTDTFEGRFVRLGKKEISGRFLYFIPTGVVDFFIPGNLDEYFADVMTLLISGTQGNGGSHFKATFKKTNSGQLNQTYSYNEIMRKRFSLFGRDDSQKANQDFNFFSAWEEAMMKDLQ